MKFIGKILVTALAAIIASYLIPGISINGGFAPIIFAVVLALMNTFIKPLFVILTIPVTVLTFGLFLLVINTVIIYYAARLVGFTVQNWWSAFWFGILISIVTYFIELLIGDRQKQKE